MSPISYSDVFRINLERGYEEEIIPGAVVRTGQNLFPHFEVIAVLADKVWIRNLQTGAGHIARTNCLRLIERSPEPPDLTA